MKLKTRCSKTELLENKELLRIKNTLIEIKILIDWKIKLCNSSEYKANYKKMKIKKEHEKIKSRRHHILLEKEF